MPLLENSIDLNRHSLVLVFKDDLSDRPNSDTGIYGHLRASVEPN